MTCLVQPSLPVGPIGWGADNSAMPRNLLLRCNTGIPRLPDKLPTKGLTYNIKAVMFFQVTYLYFVTYCYSC